MHRYHKITIILAVVVVPVAIMYGLTRSACQAQRVDVEIGVKVSPVSDIQYDNQMNAALVELAAQGKDFNSEDLAKASKVSARLSGAFLSPSLTPIDDGEIYSRATKATLALFSNSVENVKALGGAQLGSAIIISRAGIAITCFHAIQYNTPFVVSARTFEGKRITVGSILATFPEQDLAFIQLEGNEFEPLPLRLDAPAGTSIRQLGHPLSIHFLMTSGLISRYELLPLYSGGPLNCLRMDLSAQTASGFSGGPVLDLCGNVVGMSQSMRTYKRGDEAFTVAVAIPSSIISACLEGTWKR